MSMTSSSYQPTSIVDIGTINGHRIQGIGERATLIVDGTQAILCTPLEYRLALLLLSSPGVPLKAARLMKVARVGDRRTLGDVLTSLRKKLAPLGLSIPSIFNYGYMLTIAPSRKETEA